MRSLINGLKGHIGFLLLAMLLLVGFGSGAAQAGWFTGGDVSGGGFTGSTPNCNVTPEKCPLTIEISADKTSVPVNLAGLAPNPSLPYTSTISVQVKRVGQLFPGNIQLDLAPSLAPGALFDPADLTQGFRSLPLTNSSGLATAFFQSSSTPGEVTITASTLDPSNNQTVSASVKITVVGENRPATSLTFTGPYVNAVIAGQSRFGTADDTPIQDGSYSRVVSVVVNDANGNPTNPNTQINFYLIDGPITGYPTTPGAFVVAGNDGDPQENGVNFTAPTGQFLTKDVRPLDRLVLKNGQMHTVQTVASETRLSVQSSKPFGADNRSANPYVIGRALNAAILSPSFTNLDGVASTTLTYPVTQVGQTAILVACTADNSACTVLNTCDATGANCKSVFLGVTNGTDWSLTTSATELGPNSTTPVKLCLKDPNFTPLPATQIRYDMSTTGVAIVKVNEVEGKQGAVLTGADGCATVTIASSGQLPGSKDIVLSFIADNIPADAAVKITIKGPGEGKIDGVSSCRITNPGTNKTDPVTPPTAVCDVTMQMVDDNFSPLAGVLVTLGEGAVPDGGFFSVTFNPVEGSFGKTDEKGALQATVNMTGAGAFSIPFKQLNGTASFTMNFNVPAPTDKPDDGGGDGDGGTTVEPLAVALAALPEATIGVPYSAVVGTASGGTEPYTWSIESRGNLPDAMQLSSGGVLSGTLATAGAYNFVIKVVDSSNPVKSFIGNVALTAVGGGGDGGSNVTPAQLTLLASSPDLPSSGQPAVTLTAIAKDSGGVLLKDVTVTFRIINGDGTLQVTRATTDETGTATADLTTGGNKRDRTITVGAVANGIAANEVTINVSGTTLNVSGVDAGASVLVGDTLKLIFELKDSAGQGIAGETLTVTSALNGLALPPATSTAQGSTLTVKTNSSGVAEVNLTVTQNGQDTVNAAWDSNDAATTTSLPLTLNASPDSFTITVEDNATAEPDNIGISPGSFGKVVVEWLKDGVAVPGATVRLVTTKGQFSPSDVGSGGTTYTTVTDASGKATVDIQSTVPGGAVITATGQKGADSVSTQKTIQFVATAVSQLTVQANPATIAVNVPPSTSSQSTITATLRDINDNPVANQDVVFSILQDPSGGTLNESVKKTNYSGQASVTYTAGSTSTQENGVRIQATVAGLSPVVATLTVSKREVFITLGTGNTITEPDPTTYALPYNVLVNDIVGGPVQGAVVTLDSVPAQYRKGEYSWNGKVWVPQVAVSCPNEDTNNNGILDDGEDTNGNDRLDPGNVVTTSVASITTDQDGFGKFDVLYAQQYANWINNTLTARTKVGGSEDEELSTFVLPPAAADLSSENQTPPGQPSPFGVLPNCTVSVEDEASLKLTASPETLAISVGGASLGASVTCPSSTSTPTPCPGSASVTVTATLTDKPTISVAGATVRASADSLYPILKITVPSSSKITGNDASFTVEVTNTSETQSFPVAAGEGTSIGTLTFEIGDAKKVVPVNLTQ